jgi:hypothetical protein
VVAGYSKLLGMTDKQAYELFYKWSGGEKGIAMLSEMIHIAGIDKAAANIEWAYKKDRQEEMPVEFKKWLQQVVRYQQSKNESQGN